MRWIIFVLISISFSCSKIEEIGSLRIIGSNTENNYFNETTDNQTLFLKKNEMYFLNNAFVSDLNLVKISFDSIDVERVVGDSDTLLMMTKTGISAYFPKLKNRVALKNYAFTFCDQIALVDSMVIVVQGKTDCQPSINPKYSLLKLNKKTELIFLKQYNSDQILDIKVLDKKILMLSNSSLGVYEVKDGNDIMKISEIAISNPKYMRIVPTLKKILVKTEKGMAQFKLSKSLVKINEI